MIVFVAMVGIQVAQGDGITVQEAMIGLHDGHLFGDMTVNELFAGEIWRTVTSTFVHYGIAHIGMNLMAFYLIGCVLESWYGSGQFLAIYVLTGGGGNALSGFFRHLIGSNPNIASGGGSTVIMGLVGLCVVVGWRTRTRDGTWMRNSMLKAIALTAGLGLLLPLLQRVYPRAGIPMLDNWGHACGTFMGLLIGLADPWMIRQVGRRTAKLAGVLAVLVIATSASAQVLDDRSEAVQRREKIAKAINRAAKDDFLIKRLEEIRTVYRTVTIPHAIQRGSLVPAIRTRTPAKAASTPAAKPPIEPERQFFLAVVKASADSLDSMSDDLDTGDNSADFHREVELIKATLVNQPTLEEAREVDLHLRTIRDRLKRDQALAVSEAAGVR